MGVTIVSHYRLLEPLGEGGMGVVYRALDLRLGREVAVKLLRTDAMHSVEWLARFEREARLASSLHHPHICTIHELGEHEGQPFIAMERLEGLTVRRLLDGGPMAPARVLDLARQIAEALDAAHRRGIIHRDIKPANLFVTEGDQLKILDFGLAKTTPAAESPTGQVVVEETGGGGVRLSGQDLTGTGIAVGTAAYMSPEQAQGWPLDARTDLFSLGTVLYEMSTGSRAFRGDSVGRIIGRIVNGIVAPPLSVNPTIPEALGAIIQKLMTVDPDERYQTAADLLLDIQAAQRQFERQTAAPRPPEAASHPGSRRSWRRVALVPGTLGVLVAVVGVAWWSTARSPALGERDSIVVGSVQNATGEPIFDEALVIALKAQLGQSPFLDIVTEQRLRDTLRLMGRQSDDRLTHDVARDACQRLGVKAMIEGSIARLGHHYVLALNATNCQTGEPIARAQGEATSSEHVLGELGAMSRRMRTTLGESLPSIHRFNVPIEQATTPSLAALKAYALGLNERQRGRDLESIAFFNQAIELDQQFASAYVTLSTVYGSLGEWRRSERYAKLAYDLRGRVSERERLFIVYQYHDRVTGNVDRAVEALQRWKAAYPRDVRPANALALAYNRLGRYEQAVAEAQEALRRSPGHPFPLSNLAFAYRALGRDQEARKIAEEAVRLGVATPPTRRLLYQMGVLVADGSAAEQLAWGKGRPRELDMVAAEAEVAAFEGRIRDAADLYREASDIAVARGFQGTAFSFVARMAWVEALYRGPGHRFENVKRVLASADTESDGSATVLRFRTSAALGLAGFGRAAEALASRAERRYPEATFVRTLLCPSARAAIALQQGDADAAIGELRATSPTELGTMAGLVPPYLRAEAFLQKAQLTDAILEYEKVLRHRGVDPFAPVIPMSQLGMARARARAGDQVGSRRHYQVLFAMWKRADADFPPLAAARVEYERLTVLAGVQAGH